MQMIDDKELPEIGYHINKKYHHKGYASEAARAVKDYVFNNYEFDEIFTYMKYTNSNSYFTAIKNDMSLHHEYKEEKNEISRAFSIARKTWLAYKEANKNVIVRKALIKDIDMILIMVDIDMNKLIESIHSGYCNIVLIDNELLGVVVYSKDDNRIILEKYNNLDIKDNLMSVVLSDLNK